MSRVGEESITHNSPSSAGARPPGPAAPSPAPAPRSCGRAPPCRRCRAVSSRAQQTAFKNGMPYVSSQHVREPFASASEVGYVRTCVRKRCSEEGSEGAACVDVCARLDVSMDVSHQQRCKAHSTASLNQNHRVPLPTVWHERTAVSLFPLASGSDAWQASMGRRGCVQCTQARTHASHSLSLSLFNTHDSGRPSTRSPLKEDGRNPACAGAAAAAGSPPPPGGTAAGAGRSRQVRE